MPPRTLHPSARPARTLYVLHGPRPFRRQCSRALFLRYGLEFFEEEAGLATAVERHGLPDLFLAHLEAGSETILHLLEDPRRAWLRRRPLLVASPLYDEFVARACFDRGVSDFLWCPFSAVELRMRIERALATQERSGGDPRAEVRLDGRTLTLVRGSRSSSELTATEFRILAALLATPTRSLPRQELVDAVWRRTRVGPKTLDVHLSHLRAKLRAIELTVHSASPGWLELRHDGEALEATRPLAFAELPPVSSACLDRLGKPGMRRCQPAERILERREAGASHGGDSKEAAVS